MVSLYSHQRCGRRHISSCYNHLAEILLLTGNLLFMEMLIKPVLFSGLVTHLKVKFQHAVCYMLRYE